MKLALVLIVLCVAGCTNTGGANPMIKYSGFDQSTVVTIARHGNACRAYNCTSLGAQWTSNQPKRAVLDIGIFNEHSAILKASIRIDGELIRINNPVTSTEIEPFSSGWKESYRSFLIPLSLIKRITTAKRAWIRVKTPSGFIEDAIIDDDVDSKAYHAMKRFLMAVDQHES